MGIVHHSLRAFAQLGPPSAKTAAHEMKIAQGGRWSAVPPMNAVSPASTEATIS